MKPLSLVLTALSLTAFAQPAAARKPEVICGTSPNGLGLNTARGELIVSRSNSLASKVITFLGESWSHSMLSHGPGGQVTTANMFSKPGTSDNCTNPLNPADIRAPGPGATRMSNAGNYASLYLNTDPNANAVALRAKGGTNTAAIAGFFEGRVCDWGEGSVCSYKMDGVNYTPYSLFQYVNAQGSPKNNFGANLHKGAVCSTLLAGGQFGAQAREVATKSYVMADKNDIAKNAIKLIRDQVYSKCLSDPPSTLDNILCASTDKTLCDNAAVQIASVFVNGSGSSTDQATRDLIANVVSKTAHSISPHALATLLPSSAWYTNGTNPTTPLWNDPSGQAYGCWAGSDLSTSVGLDGRRGWTRISQGAPDQTLEKLSSLGGGGGGVFVVSWPKPGNSIVATSVPKLYRLDTSGWVSWGNIGSERYTTLARPRITSFSDGTGAVSVFVRPKEAGSSTTLLRKASSAAAWTVETTGPGARAYATNSSGNLVYLAMEFGQLYRKTYPGGGSYTACGNPLPADAGLVEQLGVAGGKIWALTASGRVFRMSEASCSGGAWSSMISATFPMKWLGTGSKLGDVWTIDDQGYVWNYDTATNVWYRQFTPEVTSDDAAAWVATDSKGRPYYLTGGSGSYSMRAAYRTIHSDE